MVRPLSNVVNADANSAAQVGIDPTTFKGLNDGLIETVAHYRSTMGQDWQQPTIKKDRA